MQLIIIIVNLIIVPLFVLIKILKYLSLVNNNNDSNIITKSTGNNNNDNQLSDKNDNTNLKNNGQICGINFDLDNCTW